MNRADLTLLIQKIHAKRTALMGRKGLDYANADVLSNFKRLHEAAEILDINPQRSPGDYALFMLLMKLDRWQNLRKQTNNPQCESIEDTLFDLHNYADLAFACDLDRRELRNE